MVIYKNLKIEFINSSRKLSYRGFGKITFRNWKTENKKRRELETFDIFLLVCKIESILVLKTNRTKICLKLLYCLTLKNLPKFIYKIGRKV